MKKKTMNAGKGKLTEKIPRQIRSRFVSKLRKTNLYKYCYKSYWHYLFHHNCKGATDTLYFAAKPNPGAGIGHQMANWIAGYWFARQFKLKFAHIPFQQINGRNFLDFIKANQL